jgi:carbamoyl-phosphate synthase large subunit
VEGDIMTKWRMQADIISDDRVLSVLRRNGIACTVVRKASEGRSETGEGTIVDLIDEGAIDMVVNTPSGQGARADGYEIRAAITGMDRAIVTTVQQLGAAVQGIEAMLAGPFRVRPIQELHP